MKRNSVVKLFVLVSFATVLALLFLPGCDRSPSPLAEEEFVQDSSYGSLFDASIAGSITGQVNWNGPLPKVPDFRAPVSPRTEQHNRELFDWPNVNAPQVDANTRAVRNAVVFLKEVDPQKAKPWDLDSVQVELSDYQFRIHQGKAVSRVGIVRRGTAVEFVSRQDVFHSIHAGGAAFFSLPFPDPNLASSRKLKTAGLMELTSAAGYFWMRGYLFVADHPYFARTDAQGRFHLDRVPPGNYELICWLPNWLENRHDRDPETSCWTRLHYQPALEMGQPISLKKGASSSVSFTVSEKQSH